MMSIISLANEHRRELNILNRSMLGDYRGLLAMLADESDRNWAREIRRVAPALLQVYGSTSSQLSAAFYNTARDFQVARAGKSVPRFASVGSNGLITADDLILQPKLDALSAFINNTIEGKLTREQMLVQSQGMMDRAVRNFSDLNVVESNRRDPAGSGITIIVEPSGCSFCKQISSLNASSFSGGHNNCRCVTTPLVADTPPERQEWQDDFEQLEKDKDFTLPDAGF